VLMHMYPQADIPVIQLSMDVRLSPRGHYQIGKALQGLRDEGVLIMGSGNLVHNLRLFRRETDTPPAPFAARFNDTVKAKILAGDDEALIDYPSLDPEVALCFPEPEHYQPLLYVLGARDKGESVEFVNDAVFSTVSMTSVLIGADKVAA
jgi:4,5-DOPA dioxygenase extradiol